MADHIWKPGASGYLFDPTDYLDGTAFQPGDTISFTTGNPSIATVYVPGQPPTAAIIEAGTFDFTPGGNSFFQFGLQNVGLGSSDTVNVFHGTQELDILAIGSSGNAGAINVGTSTAAGQLEISIDGLVGAPLKQSGSFLNSGTIGVAAGSRFLVTYVGALDGSLNTFANTGTINIAQGASMTWSNGGNGDVGEGDGIFRAGGTISVSGGQNQQTDVTVGAEEIGSGLFSLNGGSSSSAADTLLNFEDQVNGARIVEVDAGVQFGAASTGSVTMDGGGDMLIYAAATDLVGFGVQLSGLAAGDNLFVDYITETGLSYDPTAHVLSILDGTNTVATVDIEGDYVTADFQAVNGMGNVNGTLVPQVTITTSVQAPCYCRGTRILTDRGEIAVEALSAGDLVVTEAGEHRPIRWIGTRSYAGRFVGRNKDVLPILFRAGSLGQGVPARDLMVSPRHAMFLDGVLVPAELLAGLRGVMQIEQADEIHYFHIELDSHDVLLAEGAASESFVDDHSRGMFHNAPVIPAVVGTARYCAPRIEDGPELARIRALLATDERVGEDAREALDGHIDGMRGDHLVGWARSPAHPDVPVLLEILAGDRVIGLTLADRHRSDLETLGLGVGRHGFAFAVPLESQAAELTVRRACDRVALAFVAPGSAVCGASGLLRGWMQGLGDGAPVLDLVLDGRDLGPIPAHAITASPDGRWDFVAYLPPRSFNGLLRVVRRADGIGYAVRERTVPLPIAA